MSSEKIVDKIRRLLRLSESPNVNEAAAAEARAQELMARHRIEAAMLDESADDEGIVDHRDAPLEESKRLRPWKIELAAVLARANGCRIYVQERRREDAVVLVGRSEDAELVRAMYGEMVKRVESLTRANGAGRDRAFCNAFRLGVVVTLDERLTLARREASQRAIAGGVEDEGEVALDVERAKSAIARLDRREEAVDRFVEKNLRLGKGKTLRADAEGFAKGRVAGHAVALEDKAK